VFWLVDTLVDDYLGSACDLAGPVTVNELSASRRVAENYVSGDKLGEAGAAWSNGGAACGRGDSGVVAGLGGHGAVLGRYARSCGGTEPVPGLAALNKDYNASVNALSCWAEGYCAAAGFYTDKHHHAQAWVSLERKGRWGSPVQVPGTAALNAGGSAQVGSVSCTRIGACAAVGTYTDRQNNNEWFTAGEWGGRWGKAAPVPAPALAGAVTNSVWCTVGGLCAAGGYFTDSTGVMQAWVMTETSGRWHPALEVPGIAALNGPGPGTPGYAPVNAIVCSSPGNCVAGGSYTFNAAQYAIIGNSAFVVTQSKGVWGTAEQVPGIAALDVGVGSYLAVLSCSAVGDCTAAGPYAPGNPDVCDYPATCSGVFTVTEHNGTWKQAESQRLSDVNALTCVSAGDCVLGGDNIVDGNALAGLVSQTNGTWGKLATPANASSVSVLSCSSPGYCAAAGPTGDGGVYVASERRGTWSNAILPAGIPVLYNGSVSAVSCPPRIDLCTAGGYYDGPKGGQHAFLVGQSR
jgi:hypothetical protein